MLYDYYDLFGVWPARPGLSRVMTHYNGSTRSRRNTITSWKSPTSMVTIGSDTHRWNIKKNQEILDTWFALQDPDGDAATRILLAGCSTDDLSNEDIKNGDPNGRSPALSRCETQEEIIEKYKTLFMTWCAIAMQPDQWVKPEKLPSMFRFALQRPLLPESVLQTCTRILGLTERLEWLWPHIRNDRPIDHEIKGQYM